MISLLHPSYKRPFRSKDTISKWVSLAGTTDIEIIVSIDESDENFETYKSIYKNHKVVSLKKRNAIEAINHAAKQATGDILIVVSDDTDCEPDWALKILEAVQNRSDYILKVWDGIQKWVITMPVMDRVYYNRFGYIYHPGFKHMFCDTWLTHQAEYLGRVIVRHDIVFNHLHYSAGKSKSDEINKRADATWNDGKSLYLSLVRENFKRPNYGLSSHEATGHLQWLRRALR
jgi:glycosyltransferase involved in cell wall biosynthesis